LGFWNESTVSPLSPTTPDTQRHFRSSFLVNFLGHIAIERLSCDQPLPFSVKHVAGQIVPRPGKSSDTKQYVRIRVSCFSVFLLAFVLTFIEIDQ
jgi:acid phosphatase